MSRVVHSRLNSLIKGETAACLLVLESLVDVMGETFCHPIVVLGQVRIAWDLGAAV